MSDSERPSTRPSEPMDPQALLEGLRSRSGDLARQAYDRFVREISDAHNWSDEQRAMFAQQAEGRFGAILTVMDQGPSAAQHLREELANVGADAAEKGTSLPHLLIVLRISRDLLLQGALRMADDHGGKMGATALAFAARLLPAIDGLTDALTEGYWSARVNQLGADHARLQNIIEASPYGVYEADLDGIVRYANAALGELIGRPGEPLVGRALNEVFRPVAGPGSVGALLAEPEQDSARITFTIEADDERHSLDVNTAVRRVGHDVVGFGGIVHRSAEASHGVDTSGLVRHVEELRRSLNILVDAGNFLTRHASQMGPVQIEQAGESIRRQGERLQLIVEELDVERRGLSN